MFRIKNSINEGRKQIQEAFAKRGIADYCNALEPGRRNVFTQVFVMASGEVVKADDRVVAEIVRGLRHA